jgi:ribosomal protein L11 methylase PrmA
MRPLPSSFRDPSGFVFSHEGQVYRQINKRFSREYESCVESGLYEALISKGLMVSHEEVTEGGPVGSAGCYKIIRPEQILFITYPYEWSFSQLKSAAMLTLKVQAEALKRGFVLKDASAFNVQFVNSSPVFIDTLSFEPYVEGQPWVAYKQFCQHFLAPLALMAHTDIQLSRLAVSYIDGIPLPLVSKLLPIKTRLSYSLAVHIHFHSRMQQSYSDSASKSNKGSDAGTSVSKTGIRALTESLAKAVDKLQWKLPRTEWGNYYCETNYSDDAGKQKRELVTQFLEAIPGKLSVIQDIGANNGEFSRIAANYADLVVSQDIDPVAVELNYRERRLNGPANVLPMVQDLSAPSPAIGWANDERDSFIERSQCDALLFLALIHHIAISNNVPLEKIAILLASLTDWLVIEFVPKSDSQVLRLLATREDVFPSYNREGFETAFSQLFSVEKVSDIQGTERTLYLLRRRENTT